VYPRNRAVRATALNAPVLRADGSSMLVFAMLTAAAGAMLAALLTAQVMGTRIDHARRFAQLVRDTRRLRAHHHPAPAPARLRRRA
jgi:hypothetical protein